MQALEQRDFETDVQREVYDFVEQNGAVERQQLKAAFSFDADELEETLSTLEDDGFVETEDGLVRLSIDIGEEKTHTTDDLEYTIRPAEQSDLRGIVGVMRQVAEENDYLVAETIVDLLDHEEVVFRHNDITSRIFFVATVDDDVVGWVHLQAPNYEKLSHTAELTMGVLEEYRGHGIGSNLLERGLQWATENEYDKVYQSLPATNQDAIRFLENHRWETEAIRKAHYKIDDQYVAEQMMAVMTGQSLLPS
ncbi:GCN5-related N-acetyltransferase [Haloterrigena turkmenica DSM 5511]|uniref:GCN5-related N-acetyltransferase n=1 Tax=Haloterrigena turkmenica (strain ATCC 51198 / DSM 5511 / JCM 9101 / NCIMB 13204 / VKM B-1734 / 4k) TaxID=543526 RepID=D2RVL1_HALTV|nr:GNAT family N-acetyltransferase [Haloterrigena turkmenica]ADB59375.1 GCN5-related N-acetyltransferase [Haloterrigena turkmenica DSM 5511]